MCYHLDIEDSSFISQPLASKYYLRFSCRLFLPPRGRFALEAREGCGLNPRRAHFRDQHFPSHNHLNQAPHNLIKLQPNFSELNIMDPPPAPTSSFSELPNTQSSAPSRTKSFSQQSDDSQTAAEYVFRPTRFPYRRIAKEKLCTNTP